MSEASNSKRRSERPGRRAGWPDVFHSPSHFCALGFGAGLSPWAPGTCGTLAAVPIFFALQALGPAAYFLVTLAAFFTGIRMCARAAESLGHHDHRAIVWDEIVGLWVTMFLIPPSWGAALAGFLLFRLFDIVKPWPIRQSERLGGGLGIMIDDLLAGLLANLALRLALPWLPALSWLPGLAWLS
ncbi:MAG: phosphatidylglycerophosphatase A [Gammaproteobacteria bacterium]